MIVMKEQMKIGINHFLTQKEIEELLKEYCKVCTEKDCCCSLDGTCAYMRKNGIEFSVDMYF